MEKAEGDKILAVKQAEAEAEAKHLSGIVRACAGVQVYAGVAYVCACLHMCSHVYMRKREENKPYGESEKEGVGWIVLSVDAAACLRCLLVCVCVYMTRKGALTSNQETIACVRTHPH